MIGARRERFQGHIVACLFTSSFTHAIVKRVVIVLAFIFTGTDDLSLTADYADCKFFFLDHGTLPSVDKSFQFSSRRLLDRSMC